MALGEFVKNILHVGAQYSANGNDVPQAVGNWGDAHVSNFLPPLARLAMDGRLFTIDMSAGTPVAPVVAAPVASPQWGLYNDSDVDTMVVIMAASTIVSGTSGLGLALMGAAAIGKQTVVTGDYSGTVKSQTNGRGASPQVFLDDNPTLIGGTPAWQAYDVANNVAQVAVGWGVVAHVNGMLVAPPGGHMVAFELVGLQGTSALFDFQALVAMIRNDS